MKKRISSVICFVFISTVLISTSTASTLDNTVMNKPHQLLRLGYNKTALSDKLEKAYPGVMKMCPSPLFFTHKKKATFCSQISSILL